MRKLACWCRFQFWMTKILSNGTLQNYNFHINEDGFIYFWRPSSLRAFFSLKGNCTKRGFYGQATSTNNQGIILWKYGGAGNNFWLELKASRLFEDYLWVQALTPYLGKDPSPWKFVGGGLMSSLNDIHN